MKFNYKKRKAAKDLVQVLAVDIAEKEIKTDKDAEAALKDLQARFSSFLEQVPKDDNIIDRINEIPEKNLLYPEDIPFLTGLSVIGDAEGPVQSVTERGSRDA